MKVYETNLYIYNITGLQHTVMFASFINQPKLNAIQNNYEKYKKFTNSKLANLPKPAKISESIPSKEFTAGLY